METSDKFTTKEINKLISVCRTVFADVVITNNSLYSVALSYESGKDTSPRVTVKGHGFVSEFITDFANELGVLIFNEPKLAKELYKTVLGGCIKQRHYKKVARILARVYNFRQKTTERGDDFVKSLEFKGIFFQLIKLKKQWFQNIHTKRIEIKYISNISEFINEGYSQRNCIFRYLPWVVLLDRIQFYSVKIGHNTITLKAERNFDNNKILIYCLRYHNNKIRSKDIALISNSLKKYNNYEIEIAYKDGFFDKSKQELLSIPIKDKSQYYLKINDV